MGIKSRYPSNYQEYGWKSYLYTSEYMCIDSLQKVYSVQKYWQKSKDTSFLQKKVNRATPEDDPANQINNQSNKTDHSYSNTSDSWGLLQNSFSCLICSWYLVTAPAWYSTSSSHPSKSSPQSQAAMALEPLPRCVSSIFIPGLAYFS